MLKDGLKVGLKDGLKVSNIVFGNHEEPLGIVEGMVGISLPFTAINSSNLASLPELCRLIPRRADLQF